jgi:hypothetical protein
MLKWALFFAVVAVIAGLLGFTGVAAVPRARLRGNEEDRRLAPFDEVVACCSRRL